MNKIKFTIFPSPLEKRYTTYKSVWGMSPSQITSWSLVLIFGLFLNSMVSRYQNNEPLRHWLILKLSLWLLSWGPDNPVFLLFLDPSAQNLLLCSVFLFLDQKPQLFNQCLYTAALGPVETAYFYAEFWISLISHS